MPSRPAPLALVAVVVGLALGSAACGDDGPGASPTTAGPDGPATTAAVPTTTSPTTGTASTTTASTTPAPVDPVPLAGIEIGLEVVATARVPTAHVLHPDGSSWLTEKAGRVVRLDDGAVALDLTDRVRDRGEQGMLGLAFDADGAHLYVSYNDGRDGGATVIAEYAFADGVADPASERELLRHPQPESNHNGGDIHLGPDGMLWIGLGDGGGAGDPRGNGQDPATLLGSVLRIDPDAPGERRAYAIPEDNPFVAGGGAPEVWLYGVRNPWRFHFDTGTGDLWIADVGQNAWEEINLLPAPDRGRGANLGWNRLEGTHPFRGSEPDGTTLPVFEYSHDEGCSVTGGVVYRGRAIPDLTGSYVFADLCRSTIRAIRVVDGSVADERTFDVDAGTPIAFGTDAAGEVLVLSQGGEVRRIVPRAG